MSFPSSIIETSLSEVKEILLKEFEYTDVKIIFFGSRLQGNANHNSDIDIAIWSTDSNVSLILAKIRLKLENSNIPFKVDLVDLNTVSKEFKNKVFQEGVFWRS
jgi:uncharacterized protein